MIVFQLFWRLFGYQISVVIKRKLEDGESSEDVSSFMVYLDETEKSAKPADKYKGGRRW